MQGVGRFGVGLFAAVVAGALGTVLTFIGAIAIAAFVLMFRDEATSYEVPLVVGMFAAPIGGVITAIVGGGTVLNWLERRAAR